MKIWRFLSLIMIPLAIESQNFVPGSDEIHEADILERIQKELGQDIARFKQASRQAPEKDKAEKKAERPAHTYSIIIQTAGGESTAGHVILAQKHIEIRGEKSSVKIEIQEIKTLEFSVHRGAFFHYEPSARKLKAFFLPSECTLTQINGNTVKGAFDNLDWIQLAVKKSGETKKLKTYFVLEQDIASEPADPKDLPDIASLSGSAPPEIIKKIEFIEYMNSDPTASNEK